MGVVITLQIRQRPKETDTIAPFCSCIPRIKIFRESFLMKQSYYSILLAIMVLNSYRLVVSLQTKCRLASNPLNRWKHAHSKHSSRMAATDTPIKTPVSYDLNAVRSTLKNGHPFNNIPESIVEKVGSNLHLQKNHPLNIIKKR
jgi:hypothetical protein